jgi:hypothetical protein
VRRLERAKFGDEVVVVGVGNERFRVAVVGEIVSRDLFAQVGQTLEVAAHRRFSGASEIIAAPTTTSG